METMYLDYVQGEGRVMTKRFEIKRQVVRLFKNTGDRPAVPAVHTEDVRRLSITLREMKSPVLNRCIGRPSTEEEREVASWANLAIEEPTLTLDEARRMLSAGKGRTPVGT